MAIGEGKNGFISLASLSTATIQPPSGEEWVIRDMQPKDGTLEVDFSDGTNIVILRAASTSGWYRKTSWFITNGIYLRVKNLGGSAMTAVYNAMVTNVSGTTAGRADAKVGIASVVASGFLSVQPPSGETWMLLDYGGSIQNGPTGGFNNAGPFAQLYLYDGTTLVTVSSGGGVGSGTDPQDYGSIWSPILTNAIYARIQNLNTSTAQNIAYTAVRMS